MNLNFKHWMESYPKNTFRDIRFGRGLHNGPLPNLPFQAASHAITGMGNLFRTAMGQGFPAYGSGYRGYFDDLTDILSADHGHSFVVTTFVPQNDEAKMNQEALNQIKTIGKIQAAATQHGLDLDHPEKITHQYDQEKQAVRVDMMFRAGGKA